MTILFILFLCIGSLNTGWNPDSRCLGFEEQNLKVFSRCLKNFHVLNELKHIFTVLSDKYSEHIIFALNSKMLARGKC